MLGGIGAAAVGSELPYQLLVSLCRLIELTDGDSVKITLEDLTVESIGISKVRTFLADVQVRSLHGGPLAELIIRCLQPLNL